MNSVKKKVDNCYCNLKIDKVINKKDTVQPNMKELCFETKTIKNPMRG